MDPLSDIPSASTPTAVTHDPIADIPKADTSLPDSYRESSQNNADHVSRAQEISQRRGIDPNYALTNLPAVQKEDEAPDFDELKKSSPTTHKLISDPKVMGKAWDDIKSLVGLEDHARAGRHASNLVEAALAGFQGSGTGMSIRRGLPSTTLPTNPSFAQEAVSAGVGMVSDLPQMVVGGAAGSILGPFGAGAGGFALPAAYREFVKQQYTSGNPESAHEILKRAIGIAIPAAKQAAVGAAMVASGGGAAVLGAGTLLTKGAEVAGMTVAGSVVEGKLPSAREAALNAIMLTGAHIAGITWDRMGEAAKASKLRARDPQTFADHADNVSEPRNIPVAKWDAVLGPDAEGMAKKLDIEQAYKAAKASGGDVEIPAGKMLSADMDPHREAFKDSEVEKVQEGIDARKEEAEKQAEAEKAAPALKYSPYPGLTDVQRTAETDLAHILSKPDAVEKYAALPHVEGGKILDVDEARALSPDYNQDSESQLLHTLSTHKPAAAWIRQRFADMLSEPTNPEDPGHVLFMSGGGGSGKSTIRKGLLSDVAANSEIILDGTFQKESAARDNIEAVLKSGRDLTVSYVHRPFESAMASVKSRFESHGGGRWVPPEALANDHVMAQQTFLNMAEQYKDDPRVEFKAFNNPDSRPGSDIKPTELSLDELKALSYTKEGETTKDAIARLTEVARKYVGPIEERANEAANRAGTAGAAGTGGSRPVDEAGDRAAARRRFAEGLFRLRSDGSLSYDGSGSDSVDQGLRRLGVKQVFTPSPELKAVLDKSGFPAVILHELEQTPENEKTFSDALTASKNASPFGASVYVYPEGSYREMRTFTAEDGKSGFAVKPDGDIVSVFSDGGGKVHSMLALAVEQGGTKLDCFDTVLPVIYKANGFHEVGRDPWNEQYKPEGWSKAQFAKFNHGEPDIVYMQYDPTRPLTPLEAPGEPQTPREEREQATAQAVSAAQAETGQTAQPIPGADPRMQAELDKAQEAARKEAEKILLKPQLEELKRSNRALIDAERERATAEIGNQVGNEPVFRAFALFNPEGADHEISQKSIWKKSVDYMNNRLSDADTTHYEAVAEMSGFTSADEMAKKLLLTERGPAFNFAVKERVNAHMAQFADLKDTEAMKAEALRAVHNNQSGELIALQQQVLEGMDQNAEINAATAKARRAYASQMWETAKQLARDTINAKPVETAGRFRAYYTAERDAAVRAEKAQAAGKWQEAGAARLEQMHNHALAAESLRVRDSIDSWQASIKKQQRAEQSTWKSQDHFFQAAAIMQRFGFERPDYDPSKKVENLQGWAARMDEKTGAVEIPGWLQDESVTKDSSKLTPPQLLDVRNALKNIKHVANNENTMFTIRKGEGMDAIATDLHDAKMANVAGGKTPGAGTYVSNWQKLTHAKDVFLNNIIAPETFMSELDGFKMKGPWQDTLIESKDKAMDARGEMNITDAEKLKEIHAAYSAKELKDMRSKPIFIPELDPKGQFTKENLITLAANQGTEGNQVKVRESRGWTQETVDAVLKKHLDARDWDLVQAKLDWMESRKPAMAELHKRVTGFEPTWVEAKPIQTPFGEKAGGYYPLISDHRVVSRGFENMKTDAMLNDPPVTFKAATAQGFLKERNDNARYAVSLDGDGFIRHMSDVTHDLTMREWVIDASRILGDKGVAKDVQDSFGMENYQGLKQWLKQIAGNDVKPLREAIDGIVAGARRRSTVSQLGGKLSVMFSQIHGLTAAASVDPENFGRTDVAAGIMNVYGKMLMNPSSLGKTLELVDEKSPYMKQSGMDADRDISEAARSMHGDDANVMQFAQKGFKLMHDLTMKPLWLQAYKKGLQLNEGDEAQAVSYADKIIKGSTTGGRASDLPALMRGSETGKLITMFHGFVNAQTQLMYKAQGRVHNAADLPAFAGTYMNVMVLPGAMYALFHYGLPDDRKSQQMWQKAMIRSASPLSMVPIVSTLQDWAIDRGLGIPGHASMSPAGGGLDALYDLMQQATSRSAHTQKVLESATKVASYTGLPIPGPMFMKAFPDQYSTWLWNTVDAVHNGMTPRLSDLMKRRPARERTQ